MSVPVYLVLCYVITLVYGIDAHILHSIYSEWSIDAVMRTRLGIVFVECKFWGGLDITISFISRVKLSVNDYLSIAFVFFFTNLVHMIWAFPWPQKLLKVPHNLIFSSCMVHKSQQSAPIKFPAAKVNWITIHIRTAI